MIVLTLLLTASTALAAKRSHPRRTVEKRISWLQERVAFHRYVCRHGGGGNKVFHCKALRWSSRELTEARLEQHNRDWDWQSWMPAKWARVGACETGYGKQPGDWTWDSGVYVSAFGIIRSAYTSFAHQLGFLGWDDIDPATHQRHRATAREEYRVAAALEQRYGFGAWGCGRA